jgi:hypothetical protein
MNLLLTSKPELSNSYYHTFLSHKQITKVDCKSSLNGLVGNTQRNYGLSVVEEDNYINFLDDDNIIIFDSKKFMK